MRMPNARQISEEQQDVFEDAPMFGNILVSGPPGTGKTVIAFLRAQALAKKNTAVTVLMYNRVLRRYTENVAKEIQGDVVSKTMHSWLPDWWRKHEIELVGEQEIELQKPSRVYLNSTFSDKDDIKAAGCSWDPNARKWYVSRDVYEQEPIKFCRWSEVMTQVQPTEKNKIYLQSSFEENSEVKLAGAQFDRIEKKWWVTQDQINQAPEKFEKWLASRANYDLPELNKWHYDWETMLIQYIDLDEERVIDWGHLIIDEAQDFPPEMFKFLYGSGRCMDKGGITILADENQRLQEKYNSSLEDIRNNLRIKAVREFKLTKNFRNTKPIAELAKYFYTGLSTGIPSLPDKSGSLPKLVVVKEQSKQAEYIRNFLQLRGAQEVGVIVDSDADREFYVEKLTLLLTSYRVQYYSSSKPQSSEDLTFDQQGVITVLNRRSCKGLEFDTVFIPDLHKLSFNDIDLTAFNMNMYVMCSRARSELILMYVQDGVSQAPILKHLPNVTLGLMEYREL
ncbi:DUF5710 domain-containing protein [Vibrio mimicus]|uniref:DUF5710 domain-containing protein n=1 Tax=Vibrio mimicus TaxID=674 RepID=UPI00076B6353|nr:DUF5710 domain-containing protein [Vibrio mimicus]AMG01504.1 DNA/RNA helicase [Vibrio mimicus]KAA3493792.1 AAA family ATPase [Vibrio mimicus]